MVKINNEQYMTIHEYAAEKMVTIQTIYNWINEKKVQTKKFMGLTLVKL
jgi:hypothetical protein